MRVRELAAALNAAWEGDGEKELTGVADIEAAGFSELSFAASRKAVEEAHRSSAGCLIVTPDFPNAGGRTVIRAGNPRAAFARAVAVFYPAEPPVPNIHPSAVVAPSAKIDATVRIGPHTTVGEHASIGARTSVGSGCSIGDDATVGADCVLHANVAVYHDVSIGDRVTLHSGCVLGADGFGFVFGEEHYEKFPQIGSVVIDDDVEIGANSCVDRAALGVTRIGQGTKLDNMVHVAHNCRIGRHVVIAAQTGLSGGVVIGDYAVIGGQVGIGDKARIEAHAVLGSGSGVLTSKIVHGGQVLWGTPARPLKQYLEQLANIAKIGEMREQMARLQQRLAALEAVSGTERRDTTA
jgi:UDP-3-O-[3-hydroxymyristoyl] glucosamine N-acyltransferase